VAGLRAHSTTDDDLLPDAVGNHLEFDHFCLNVGLNTVHQLVERGHGNQASNKGANAENDRRVCGDSGCAHLRF